MSGSDDVRQRKAEAQEHWAALKQAAGMQSTSSMEIGYEAYFLKKNNLFGALGFADEHEARIAAGVGESTWYANIRLAQAYEGIPKAKFIRMKQANAKAMADLPESQRLSDVWIKDAATWKIEEFAEAVDKEMHGKSRRSDGKERSTSITITVPASRKEVIKERAEAFAEEHGISKDDPGKAIELALVEATEGVTLIGTITTVAQGAKEIRKYLEKSEESVDEQLAKVKEFVDNLILTCKTGLDQASASQNQKKKAA